MTSVINRMSVISRFVLIFTKGITLVFQKDKIKEKMKYNLIAVELYEIIY